ncbi:MAG: thioredoxin [Solirubrobacterales bacterium]|nr:thioredoxin [Solirubrobacterales bacterium]MBV9717365.1 thioredoxin [Solirubrobacterales bacterium]
MCRRTAGSLRDSSRARTARRRAGCAPPIDADDLVVVYRAIVCADRSGVTSVPDATIVRCANCGTANRVRAVGRGVPQCASCHQKLAWLVDADGQSFAAEAHASVPVLVDFWAPWCGPCRMVSPVLERIARTRAGRVKVIKVNTDAEPSLAQRFRVQGIPLIVLMRDGAEVDRRVGALPEQQLAAWLEPHLSEGAG